jgi:hypothetical protein
MGAEDTLKLLDSRMAETIRSATSRKALREFACACARLALSRAGVNDPAITRAAALSEAIGEPDEDVAEARRELGSLIDRLDEIAFDLRDRADAGQPSVYDEYRRGFAAARAVASLDAALNPDPLTAAAEACYEALAAKVDREVLATLARSQLTNAARG